MSAISVIQTALTMTSREIAEVTGKEHFNVKRDISAMILQLNNPHILLKDCPDFHPSDLKGHGITLSTYDHCGNAYDEFTLNQEYCLLLVSGYSVTLRQKIIKRWQELENKNSLSLPDFSNPVEAARAWADAKEAEQKALAQIEASKPALLVYEALANRRMDCNTTTLAKQLGTTATKLNIFLKSAGIKFKHQDLPMANYSEWFNVVTGVAKNGYETIQCLITPIGQIEIAKIWSEK